MIDKAYREGFLAGFSGEDHNCPYRITDLENFSEWCSGYIDGQDFRSVK